MLMEATEMEISLDVDTFSLKRETSPDNMGSNSLPRIERWLQMRLLLLLLCGQKRLYILLLAGEDCRRLLGGAEQHSWRAGLVKRLIKPP